MTCVMILMSKLRQSKLMPADTEGNTALLMPEDTEGNTALLPADTEGNTALKLGKAGL